MKILGVTACVAGVAHTYMAAEALEQAAKARGHEIKVETQGAGGIENYITKEDIANADCAIFAVDVGVTEAERFDDLPTLECKIKEVIKNASKLIIELEDAVGIK